MPGMTPAQYEAYRSRVPQVDDDVYPMEVIKPTLESALHDFILSFCRGSQWIALHGSMAQATSRTLGEPDFTILADKGRVFFIECKSKDGKLTREQDGMRHWMTRLGHAYHIVRTQKEFLQVVGVAK